jgi:hypothetical protein
MTEDTTFELGPGGKPLIVKILLSAQRALLGEVSPALRGVTLGWHDQVIRMRAYFDGPISEEDLESMTCVAAQIIADFPSPWNIDEEIVRCDAPERMEFLQVWAYLRRE